MALVRVVLLAAALSLLFLSAAEAGTVGVNYGRVANNLPNPAAVVQLLKQQGITQVKLYDTDPTVLRALGNTGIKVVVALPNEQLAAAAARASYALAWVRRNVAAYYPATQIQGVAVGNEVFATAKNVTAQLVPAMNNVHAALTRLNLDKAVKVSSPIALTALAASYPPSAGAFREDLAQAVMKPMLDFLAQTGSYLMVNAYPFFAYSANADVISLDYALFRPNAGVLDSGSGLKYYSLLDAQLDAVFTAVGKVGNYNGVRVVVSETGWPSKGDAKETGAAAANAAAYNSNLVRRVLSGNAGTPHRPDADMDVYLFALFNENQKPGPTSERNYGLFYPNQQKVYDVEFVLGGNSAGGGGSKDKGGLGWQENGGPSSGNAPSAGGGVKATSTGEAWCVANAMVGEERLHAALDYACGPGGADCKAIQPGAACFEPNTMVAHASYALNDYYQRKGRSIGTCDFAGAAYVVNQAPRISLEEAEQAARVFLGPYTGREHKQRVTAIAEAGLGRINRVCEALGLAVPDRVARDDGAAKKETPSRKRGRGGAPVAAGAAAAAASASEGAADAESDSARYADSGLGGADIEGGVSSAIVPDGGFAASGRGGEPHRPPKSPRQNLCGPTMPRWSFRPWPLWCRRRLLRGRTEPCCPYR